MITISNKANIKLNKTGNISFYSAPSISIGQYTLNSPYTTSMGIYRASDPEPKTLLRTLWGSEPQEPGTYTIYWDGLDDNGNNIVATNDYEAGLLKHNVSASWSTIGNTSTLNHGSTTLTGYSRMVQAVPYGDNIYIGESWNEGGNKAAFKILKTDLQSAVYILPGSDNGNNTNLSTEYLCTDGVRVYWGGVDPANGDSWIFATNVSDDSEATFISGSSHTAGGGRTYSSVIDLVTGSGDNIITGMATNGTYLWSARGSTNAIKAYNISGSNPVGNLTSTSTASFSNPRSLAYDSSNGGRIFFVNTSSTPTMTTIGTSGSLTTSSLSIPDFPSDVITFGINNSSSELAAIIGGPTQQVWFWNISAPNPSGTNTGKLGQLGGYGISSSNVLVANDKFSFTDYTTGLTKGLNLPYVSYDSSSGYIYVGDVGNNRIQIFNSSSVYVDTVMMQPAIYSVSLNMNNPLKAYIGPGIEYDLSSNGAWTLYRNFSAQITPTYYSQAYDVFRWCSTLSNERTYATLPNSSTYPPNTSTELVELTDTGIRYTGIFLNKTGSYFGDFLTPDFSILAVSGTFNVGDTPNIVQKTITSFSGSNPVISSFSTIYTFPPITSGSALWNYGYESFYGVTNDNKAIIVNKQLGLEYNYHLEGYNIGGSGAKTFAQWRPNSRAGDIVGHLGYIGSFPDPIYFERGNSVNTKTFEQADVRGNLIAVAYIGEAWKGVQTNYTNIYYTNGLPVIQMGTDRKTSQAIEPHGIASSGNGFSIRLAALNSNKYFMAQGDEGYHSAGQLWIIDGVDTIVTQTIPITVPVTQSLPGINLLSNITLPSLIVSTGSITVSSPATSSTWTIQSGNLSYNPYEPDISLRLDASNNQGITRYVDIGITPPYNPSLTSWNVNGNISFSGFYGPELFTSASTAIFQVIDDGGLVISQIGLGQKLDTGDPFTLTLNNSVLIQTSSAGIIQNTLGFWQAFNITTNSLGSIITYGNYSPVSASIMNPSANWNKPTNVRIVVKDLNTFHYGTRCIGAQLLRYSDQ
jgi:hypothetical protein